MFGEYVEIGLGSFWLEGAVRHVMSLAAMPRLPSPFLNR